MSRPLPPRPDVPQTVRRPDRTIWVVVSVFAAAALVATVIVADPPPSVPRPARTGDGSAEAQTVPTGPGGPYSFLEVAYLEGERVPVRWNPCQPIEYQVNTAGAPPGMALAIRDAIEQTSDATGISFRSRGETSRDAHDIIGGDYFANPLRSVYHPVLIDIVTHREFRTFHEPARVIAFAHPQQGNGDLNDQYVAGFIVVDGGARYAPTGRWSMELIVLHELGHLLGLGHVRSPDEVMYSVEVARHTTPNPIFTWGEGDLAGLDLLGADQGCLETVKVAG